MKPVTTKMNTTIGIIGGQGWMGRSLGLAWLEQNLLSADQLVVSARSGRGDAYRDWPGVRCVQDNQALVERVDVIVLSVRPEDLCHIHIEAHDKLIISLLAMAPVQAISSQLGSCRVVRAMPNAAAEIRRGYFPWYASEQVTQPDQELVQALLASCGMARELPSESALDYMTALSGAGPAYPALLAKVMLEHARNKGIADDIALEAVMQTLVGGSLLLESLGSDPGEMVERLIAYNGTTAKGLRAMIGGNIDEVIQRGLDAAYQAASSDSV
ncbi:pyrroline-5-carboxylate reductase family protein [Halomonas binhaiensis]|uniref:Pyrroline-5-carboxylate reductase n=1 Tax=Halomonas binhaiensis TaxID=2562282 RepID=A0A856QRR1_9GAMM|nr:pyrroline-5-carboxylate reductase dimerization domain-containing protein [Halomonas binhaiensis]QEM82590.2 NAD(P)-binding domain-containing protein [Halomonas binhaiensis]